jgi:hypothetical protein
VVCVYQLKILSDRLRNRQLAELALLTGTLALGTPGIHMVFLARKCELARQLPASLKPFQMIEKSAKSYMKRFRAAGCEFRILISD